MSGLNSLYLVLLGGKAHKANVEVHDLRWLVTENIDDSHDQLRKEWFGRRYGLHIDSYVRVDFVDGYHVKTICDSQLPKEVKSIKEEYSKEINDPKLWFVNIGGYYSYDLAEHHQYGLVVASTKSNAKEKALKRFLIKSENRHNDNLNPITCKTKFDKCQAIEKIMNWRIFLEKDPLERHQLLYPDWYGYRRIDQE